VDDAIANADIHCAIELGGANKRAICQTSGSSDVEDGEI
jgi:hypothetical protein